MYQGQALDRQAIANRRRAALGDMAAAVNYEQLAARADPDIAIFLLERARECRESARENLLAAAKAERP